MVRFGCGGDRSVLIVRTDVKNGSESLVVKIINNRPDMHSIEHRMQDEPLNHRDPEVVVFKTLSKSSSQESPSPAVRHRPIRALGPSEAPSRTSRRSGPV